MPTAPRNGTSIRRIRKLRRIVGTALLGAAIAVIAAAVAWRGRGRRASTASATDEAIESSPPSVSSCSAPLDVTAGAPSSSPAPLDDPATDESDGRWARTRAFLVKGFTPTVGWLFVVGALGTAYGWYYLPESPVRQPPQSTVEVDFSPEAPATSPISVGLSLDRTHDVEHGRWTVTLAIALSGADLALPNWSLFAVVPAGVRVNGAQDNDLEHGRVSPWPYGTDSPEEAVYIAPGAVSSGKYTALLMWDDDEGGPLRVRGANLVASLPAFRIANQPPPDRSGSSMPQPGITVERDVSLAEDFTYLGGLPPDKLTEYQWSWNPQEGRVGDPEVVDSLQVEARSASRDEQAHSDEFKSGIAFGIVAAALVGGIQEFLNERRKKRPSREG